MNNVYDKAREAAQYIKQKILQDTEIAIVLTQGLEDLSEILEERITISFSEIPHFNKATNTGKVGQLLFGKAGGKFLYILQGQYSCFEGCHITEVIFPIRVFRILGIKQLILTSTAAGVNQSLQPGSILAITDHINMMGVNPLFGHNDEKFGSRFPDMTTVYKPIIHELIINCMKEMNMDFKSGTLVALFGPNSETPTETKMIQMFGADAISLGTVPESIVANHMGMQVGALVFITKMAAGVANFYKNSDIKEITQKYSKLLQLLLNNIIKKL